VRVSRPALCLRFNRSSVLIHAGKFIEKRTRSEDTNALVLADRQKIFVAGDDDVCMRKRRALNYRIIIMIPADSLYGSPNVNKERNECVLGER